MRQVMLATFVFFLLGSAWAYRDGVYRCKNIEGLPDNVYRIETVEIQTGIKLPFIEATRYLSGEGDSVHQAVIKGLATQANHNLENEPMELLSVGTIRLEFRGDTLLNCKTPD